MGGVSSVHMLSREAIKLLGISPNITQAEMKEGLGTAREALAYIIIIPLRKSKSF